MATKIQLRRDTEANWTSNNPILASGEIGIATDQDLFKIGNGADAWNSLKYASAPMGTSTNGGLSIGIGTTSNESISIGHSAKSSLKSMSIGESAKSTTNGISIGRNAESSTYGTSIGMSAKSTAYGISIGGDTESATNGINIGARNVAVPEKTIQIGTTMQEALKIPAIAGATNGMTLKIDTDGTIYAE